MRLVVVLGILIAAAGSADADCAIPQWVGTATGTKVPLRGTLFVHDESLGWNEDAPPELDVGWSGTVFTQITRVERAVARIDYVGSEGSEISFKNRYGDETYTYKLDADWVAPTKKPRVLQYWHHVFEWTCSSSDELMIQLDQPTAAVRARWTINGHTVEYVEAARTDGTKAVVSFGKTNCGGASIPPEQLADGGEIELYAIRLDGSEVRIPNMPRRVTTSEMPAREDNFEDAFTIVTQKKSAHVDRAPASKWVGAAVLALLALGGVLGMRLRVRAPTDV
ncbi:MAG: hypothetical protein HOV81_02410 [Kofleriaceae bacterium]|nr:hypothetical protein [Kofleriaceae bacterium]